MLAWLFENYLTIICIAAVALLICAAIAVLIRDKRKGRSSCAGNCAHCPMGGSCQGCRAIPPEKGNKE